MRPRPLAGSWPPSRDTPRDQVPNSDHPGHQGALMTKYRSETKYHKATTRAIKTTQAIKAGLCGLDGQVF